MLENNEKALEKFSGMMALLCAISLASITAVLYTPALPELTTVYKTSKGWMQFTVTIYLLGYCLGPLIYGPLSNAYGRRRTLILAIGSAAFCDFLCIISAFFELYWLLVLSRFFLALGASAGLSVTITMIGDTFTHRKARKLMSWANLAFAIGPGAGVILGGIITEQISAISVFYFTFCYNVLVFLLSLKLPETLEKINRTPLVIHKIIKNYLLEIKNPLTFICGLLMGCSTAITYIYSVEAPFIGIAQMGLTAQVYGLWNAFPLIGMVLGVVVSLKTAHKWNLDQILKLALYFLFFGTTMMFICFVSNWYSTTSLFITQSFNYFGVSLISSNCSAIAVSQSQNKAVASSMISGINIGLAFFMVFIINSVAGIREMSMPVLYFILCAGIYFGMRILRKLTYQSF